MKTDQFSQHRLEYSVKRDNEETQLDNTDPMVGLALGRTMQNINLQAT